MKKPTKHNYERIDRRQTSPGVLVKTPESVRVLQWDLLLLAVVT